MISLVFMAWDRASLCFRLPYCSGDNKPCFSAALVVRRAKIRQVQLNMASKRKIKRNLSTLTLSFFFSSRHTASLVYVVGGFPVLNGIDKRVASCLERNLFFAMALKWPKW